MDDTRPCTKTVPPTRCLRPQHGDAAKWQVLSLAVESRAAESVLSHMLIQDRPIRETWASKNGLNYISATGDPIPNLGEQRLPLITREGSTRSMTLQAAPVDRPLGSVKRMRQAVTKSCLTATVRMS